ncbi:OmpA family protein [Leadbetterella sp. DM7]|uniref:OmpA family protein n=1 Tax=Leadbetterella sp. DM7 TaxID=3235085 RepID=UPI00349E7FF0
MRLSFSLFIFSLFPIACFSQKKGVINVKGSFYDDSTGLDLPTKIYSISKGKKEFLGQSYREEIFNHKYNFNLKPEVDSLAFESEGYETRTLPLYFHGKFDHNIKLYLSIRTLKINARGTNRMEVYFCGGKNPDNQYKMMHYSGNTLHSIRYGRHMVLEMTTDHKSTSHYVVQILSPAREVLSEAAYPLLPGINLVDVSTYSPATRNSNENRVTNTTESLPGAEDSIQANTSSFLSVKEPHPYESGIPSVYFEQGKYALNDEAKKILDEVTQYLNQKPRTKIKIKGFTDGVGEKALNETLARYRAQVVANYLMDRGTPSDVIRVEWQKEEDMNNSEEQKAELSQSRKVTINEIIL